MKVINDYKVLYKQTKGVPLNIDIPLPKSEIESKEMIQSLEVEIQQLKEDQRLKEKNDIEDMLKAEELQKKFEEEEGRAKQEQEPQIPPNADKNVVNLMAQIKSIYKVSLDYESALAYMMNANMDVVVAVNQFESYSVGQLKLTYNGRTVEERISTQVKGQILIDTIFDTFNIPRNNELFIYLNNWEAKPLEISTLRNNTLGDLNINSGSTLFILSNEV